jgi:hypothetical protein
MLTQQATHSSIFQKSTVPGPGTYESVELTPAPKYTIYQRTPDHSLDEKMKVPGPGQYNIAPLINKTGRYSSSKYENSRCSIMSKSNYRVKTE